MTRIARTTFELGINFPFCLVSFFSPVIHMWCVWLSNFQAPCITVMSKNFSWEATSYSPKDRPHLGPSHRRRRWIFWGREVHISLYRWINYGRPNSLSCCMRRVFHVRKKSKICGLSRTVHYRHIYVTHLHRNLKTESYNQAHTQGHIRICFLSISNNQEGGGKEISARLLEDGDDRKFETRDV